MSSNTRTRRQIALGVLGAVVFLPYALSKSSLSSSIVATEYSLLGLTPETTANAVHLFETVPVLLLAVSLGPLVERYDLAEDSIAWAGTLVALTGFATMVVFHWFEHLVIGPTVPVIGFDLFVTGYYVGWMLITSGLCAVGARLTLRDGRTVLSLVLTSLLPVALAVSAVAVATGLYTFAGTHRVALSIAWIVGWSWLWATDRRVPSDDESVDSRGVDPTESH